MTEAVISVTKPDNYSEFFVIGEIVNTQGVKGDVRTLPATDDIKRFELLKEVYVEKNGAIRVFCIEKVWYHKQFVVLKFEGIDDATTAEGLKRSTIKIPPSLALPLDEDEYYERDLIGMSVYENGELLGRLDRILHTGANDVYCVKIIANDKTGKAGEILIPAIKQCVISVDTANKEMVVSLLPGMRE